jgi:hypothetical protein
LSKNAQFETPPDKDARMLLYIFIIFFFKKEKTKIFKIAFDYNAKPDKFYFEAEVSLNNEKKGGEDIKLYQLDCWIIST